MQQDPHHIAPYFSPIPLEPHGKIPVLNSWQDPESRSKYDLDSHNGNIGLVIGSEYMVMDLDPRNKGDESFIRFRKEYPVFDMLFTASVLTAGGGAHFYFKLPAAHGLKIKKSLDRYPGIDWLSGNRYVVAPGSVNGQGSWRWFKEPVTTPPEFPADILAELFKVDAPKDLPDPDGLWGVLTEKDLSALLHALDVTDFAEHDKWLELMLACHHATAGDGKDVFLEWSTQDPTYSQDYEQSSYRWDTLTDRGPSERPITARSLVRHFEKGKAPEWLLKRLDYQDPNSLFKALEPAKVENVAEAVLSSYEAHKVEIYAKRNDPMALELTVWPAVASDSQLTAVTRRQLGNDIAKKLGVPFSTLDKSVAKKEPQAAGEADEDQVHLSVAEGALQALGGASQAIFQAGDFWAYNNKHWEIVPDTHVRHKINVTARNMGAGGHLTGPFISSVGSVLQTLNLPAPQGYWNPEDDKVRVNLADCMIELDSAGRWQMSPHDKDHRMNYVLNISPQQGETPWFDKYMADAVNSDQETIDALLSAMVYTVTSKKQWWKKCFFLHGDTDCGKSVFLSLMENLIPSAQRDSLAMEDLNKNFSLSSLRGKLMNVSGEINSAKINSEAFKKLIAGDSISADRKNQSKIVFNNNAIFWFAGNEWPNLQDKSSASLNRITLIEFPNRIPEERQDTALLDKLTEELPAIFYKALQVFAREYIIDKGMTIRNTPKASKEAFATFRATSQPIHQWADDSLRQDAKSFTTSTDMYQSYVSWAKLNGRNSMNSASFYQRAPSVIGAPVTRRAGVRGYEGVALISPFGELLEN